MKRFRVIIQTTFFIIFFVLLVLTEYAGKNEIRYPVKFFLDFNPLILITTILASHGIPAEIPKTLFLSVFLIILTVFLGRVFCGWICPFGSLNHFIGYLSSKKKSNLDKRNHGEFDNRYKLKYLILIFILISSLFTLHITGILDPLSLLIRSFAISINPILNYFFRSFFDFLYFTDIKVIKAISEPIYSLLKKVYLSFNQPYFSQVFIIGMFFFGILFLNLIKDRFWCRFLCPLGALLGLFSRFSFIEMKVDERCKQCKDCMKKCQGGRMLDREIQWMPSECMVCFCCVDECREGFSHFRFRSPFQRKVKGIDLGRRHILTSAAFGIFAVPLIKLDPKRKKPVPSLIRPPGAVEEDIFLERCVKCGECMKVCLTNGLQPTLFEAGLEGIWSPILVSRLGYCEYYCNLCGQVCPTGAIIELTVEEKVKIKIGLAFIDKDRCLPYALDTPCIVCEEVCPTPKKAIWFRKKAVVDKKGKKIVLQQPVVDADLCIGCGICENLCPVIDKPAIVVTSIGESRSKTNQLPMVLDRDVFGKRI